MVSMKEKEFIIIMMVIDLKEIGKNDKRELKGIYYSHHGEFKDDRYEGDWKDDKREGKGIYYYMNGDIYEGDWKNGIKEGKGIYYCNNGKKEIHNYLDGEEIN